MDSYWQPAMVETHRVRCLAAIIILAAVTSACRPHDYGLAREVTTNCATDSAAARFFNGVLGPTADTGLARTQGFAETFERFDLPPLSCGVGIDEAYRIAYAPQRAESLILSAVRNGAERHIISLRIRNSDKTVVRSETKSLNEDEWRRLETAFAAFNLWSRTPYPSAAGSTHAIAVAHGSAWIVEARKEGRYHALSRISNARERDFDGVAQVFFMLAGLDVPGEFTALRY
jgi:hypothetical protein